MLRSLCAALALFLVLPFASVAAESDPAAGLIKAEIESIVRDYLIEHPEVIVEALQKMQEREEMAQAERTRRMIVAHADRLDDPTGRFVAGNPDGDVTIVEFFDYRCGYCKRVMPTLFDEVERDGNVRLVFKEFPVLGEESVLAARAGIAAAEQDRYRDMHLALMQTRGGITEDRIMAIAGDLGLDTAQLKREMFSSATEAELSANYELAQMLGIRGTPGFVIGTEVVPGAIGPEQFRQFIDAARKSSG